MNLPAMIFINDRYLECSKCGFKLGSLNDEQLGMIPLRMLADFRYCPGCGIRFELMGGNDYERNDNKRS